MFVFQVLTYFSHPVAA